MRTTLWRCPGSRTAPRSRPWCWRRDGRRARRRSGPRSPPAPRSAGSTAATSGWRRNGVHLIARAPPPVAEGSVSISGWSGFRAPAAVARAAAAADWAAALAAAEPAAVAAGPAGDPAVAAAAHPEPKAAARGRVGGCGASAIPTAARACGAAGSRGWAARQAVADARAPAARCPEAPVDWSSAACLTHARSTRRFGPAVSRRCASKSAPPHRHW